MPLLSVLIPALNAEASIGDAVRSTLRDMPADAEIVLMDDGSTDATCQRAQEAADSIGRASDLRILHHETPQGVTKSLNELLASSDSLLVGRMDADDISLPGRFLSTGRALAAGNDIVFSQVIKSTGWKKRPNPPVTITPQGFAVELLLTNPVAHSAMLARRSVYTALDGYREVPAEDYDLWLRAALHGYKMCRLARWGLLYQVHPNQLTGAQGWFGSSWKNPLQAQAYADLSQHLTSHRLRRLVAIAQEAPQVRDAELDIFEAAVTPVVNTVPGAHGVLIRRRLKKRLEWARNVPHDLNAALEQRRQQR